MRRFIGVTMMALVMGGGVGQAAQKDFARFKLSLFPPVATTPSSMTVSGLDLGVIATQTKDFEGVQIGMFYAGVNQYSIGVQTGLFMQARKFDGAQYGIVAIADDVRGAQDALVSIAKNLIGYQASLVSVNDSIKGMQTGLVNVSKNASGLQLGLVNYTEEMDGLQVGLVNIITKSSLPAMIIVNYQFK